MKITKQQLQRLVKEEIGQAMGMEEEPPWPGGGSGAGPIQDAYESMSDALEAIRQSIDGEQGPERWKPVLAEQIPALQRGVAAMAEALGRDEW